ncbi:MAG: GyrI-like domain-containing protein [Actinocatenispora sp.]
MTTSDTAGGQPAPELTTIAPATTAVIRDVVPMSELRAFFDKSFGTLPGTVVAQQVEIVGGAFAFYHRPPDDTVDLEVGFSTDRAVEPADGVVASSLPGGRVARVVHAGSFDGLGESWERLRSWIVEQGLTAGPHLWEVYLTAPTPDMDPADLRTELNWPIAD